MAADPSTAPVTPVLDRGRGADFPELAARYLEEYLAKIRFALETVDDHQLWWRPAPRVNSLGNQLLHLEGNLSLWILHGLKGEDYQRDRAGELTAHRSAGKEELLDRLAAVVARAAAVLRGLDRDALGRPRDIQGYATDTLGVAFHAVEHMSYHTGQILLLVKQQLEAEEELELYPQHAGE